MCPLSFLAVEQDARVTFHAQPGRTIRRSQAFALAVARRIKPLDQMTPEEKNGLRALMDRLLPLMGQGRAKAGKGD
jgi:hypothetical protein